MTILRPNIKLENYSKKGDMHFGAGSTYMKIGKVEGSLVFYTNKEEEADLVHKLCQSFGFRLLDGNVCYPKNGVRLINQTDHGLLLISFDRAIENSLIMLPATLMTYDLSNNWQVIQVTSEKSREILGRICDFDFYLTILNQTVIVNVNDVSLYVIITNEGFELLFPQSYTVSFFDYLKLIIGSVEKGCKIHSGTNSSSSFFV